MNTDSLSAAIERFDWEAFLSGVTDVELRGTQLAGLCPFCGHYRESLYVHPEKGLWICHYCDRHGGPVQLVSLTLDCTYAAAIQRIIEGATDEDQRRPIVTDAGDLYDQPEWSLELPEYYRPLAARRYPGNEEYWKYANKRGLLSDVVDRYQIGYCRVGEYARRLIVPVFQFGVLKSFVARSIHDNADKTVRTPPGNKQSEALFNIEQVWGQKSAVVVEGVFDALALPDKAVATFGHRMSVAQAALLQKAGCKDLVICWDADSIKEMASAAARLAFGFDEVRVAILPPGHDPNSAPIRVLKAAVAQAKPIGLITNYER